MMCVVPVILSEAKDLMFARSGKSRSPTAKAVRDDESNLISFGTAEARALIQSSSSRPLWQSALRRANELQVLRFAQDDKSNALRTTK
jgi:hypothetical protein